MLEGHLRRKFAEPQKLFAPTCSWERERKATPSYEGRFDYFLGRLPSCGPWLASSGGDASTDDGVEAQSGVPSVTFRPSLTHVLIEEQFFELGQRVWDCCIMMSKYLEANPDVVQGKRVLEVGAGTGLLGLVAARLGAESVLLTEYSRCIAHLEKNVRRNDLGPGSGVVSACLLDWTRQELPEAVLALRPDAIVAADVVVFPQDVPHIVDLFERLLRAFSAAETPVCILVGCVEQREAHGPFLEAGARFFMIEPVPREEWHPHFVSDHMALYRLTLKQ